MKIVTFYSYKGGVGRSTVLCNVAYALAEEGAKVLIVDFDIESCGLYAIVKRQSFVTDGKYFQSILCCDSTEVLEEITESILIRAPKTDNVFIVPAGIDHTATKEVNDLIGKDRSKVLNNVEHFIKYVRNKYEFDYLFFDSRAGISNMAEPAFTFSDAVVLAFRLGIQQQIGIEGLVRWLVNYYLLLGTTDVNLYLLGSNIHKSVMSSPDIGGFVEMIEQCRDEELERNGEELTGTKFPIHDCGVVWQGETLNLNGSMVLFNAREEILEKKEVKDTIDAFRRVGSYISKLKSGSR